MTANPDIDQRPLRAARIAIGAIFLLRPPPIPASLPLPFLAGVSPLLGWPDGNFHAPVALLRLPPIIVAALCVIRTIAALSFMLGISVRTAGLAAGICGYLVLAQDAFGYAQTLHLLFLSTILLAIALPSSAPTSGAKLIRYFVVSIYGWAALAKLRPDWLDGRTLALYHEDGGLRGALAGPFIATATARAATAWVTLGMELALGPLLLHPRTRRIAIAIAIPFHLGLELTAKPDLFSWLMIALLVGCLAEGQRSQRAPSAGQTTSA